MNEKREREKRRLRHKVQLGKCKLQTTVAQCKYEQYDSQ